MMKAKYLIIIFVLVFAGLFSNSVSAESSGTCGENLTWVLDDEGTLTISGTGAMADNEFPWNGSSSLIKTLIINSGVTSIGDGAFVDCYNLSSITLPDSVTSIGEDAFPHCTSLVSIEVASENSYYSSVDGVLFNRDQTELICCPGSKKDLFIIPVSVTSIGMKAFYNCTNLTCIMLHDSVTSIGNYAFHYDQSGSSLPIPNLTIYCQTGSCAQTYADNNDISYTTFLDFGRCGKNLTWTLDDEGTLVISGTGAMWEYAYSNPWKEDAKNVIIENGVTSIGGNAFSGCSILTNINISDSVTTIGGYAFSNCVSLTNIEIPNSVTSINVRTFGDCTSLTNITIPDSVQYIGNYAFYGCSSLTSIIIPSGVKSIGFSTFSGCSSLTNVVLADSVTSLGQYAFAFCDSLTGIYIPDSITSIGALAFYNCSNLMSVNIPYSVTNIENRTFSGCASLTSIEIPSGVTSIGTSAFEGCNNLTSIEIPDTITEINENAFRNCINLTNINIPDCVTSIGKSAFYNCRSLTSIDIPDGITIIEDNTFSNCIKLISIDIPDGVTRIGDYAFSCCTNLKYITIPDSVNIIGNRSFSSCIGLTNIIIPDSINSIGASAFSDCKNLTCIKIPAGITTIMSSTFYNCGSLTCVTIPSSVTSIGMYAFSGCDLTSVTIPDSITTIGDYAFSDLDKICFAGMVTEIHDNAIRSVTTVYCYEYSDADLWSIEKGFSIVYLDNLNLDDIRTITLPVDFRMAKNESIQFYPYIFPDYDNPTIEWTSSNPDIVSVSDGFVTALSPGTATITAQVGTATASTTVTSYIEANSFNLSPSEEWIVAKETLQLTPTDILPIGAEINLTWESNDSDLAIVDENGLVTAKRPSDDVVIITARSNKAEAKCRLRVCYPVTAIELSTDSIALLEGEETNLTAYVTMRTQTCENHLVTFSSSDESIVTVDENGLVQAHGIGEAIITVASANGVTANCTVNVNEIMKYLTLPEGLKEIGDEAFAGVEANVIVIPNEINTIAENAFDGSNIRYIYGYEGTLAEEYAEQHGLTFVPIN